MVCKVRLIFGCGISEIRDALRHPRQDFRFIRDIRPVRASWRFRMFWIIRLQLWPRSDIHCQYWKSIVYVTCIIDFQCWHGIWESSLRSDCTNVILTLSET